MSEFKTVRGMRDFLPREAKLMRYIESKARNVALIHGYQEIITPIVESYELLSAKTGEEVRQRMFVFKDLGERDVALRPEFTTSVARLVATTLKTEPKPYRFFSVGSVYRYDEPQRGRYREFWQSDFELIGSDKPEADAEILMLTNNLMQNVGLRNLSYKIGHVGIFRGIFNQERIKNSIQNAVMQLMDKKQYDDALRIVKESGASENCLDAIRGLTELRGKEVLNIVEKVAALVKDYREAIEAVTNLKEILQLTLGAMPEMNVIVDAGFARGLEYYTGMIFEVTVPELDIALGGGGRYDKLIEIFGGEPTPAQGVAHGLDRMMMAIQEQQAQPPTERDQHILVIPLTKQVMMEALSISQMLRTVGLVVETEVMGRKITKALEDADRRGIDFAVIVGEKELKDGCVALRNLKLREQKTVKIGELAETLKNAS